MGGVRDLPAEPGLLRAADHRTLPRLQQLLGEPGHLRLPVGELPEGLQAGVQVPDRQQRLAAEGRQGDTQQGGDAALHQLHQRVTGEVGREVGTEVIKRNVGDKLAETHCTDAVEWVSGAPTPFCCFLRGKPRLLSFAGVTVPHQRCASFLKGGSCCGCRTLSVRLSVFPASCFFIRKFETKTKPIKTKQTKNIYCVYIYILADRNVLFYLSYIAD